MPRRIIADQEALYFLTMTTIEWIDLFTRKVYKDILIECLQYCREHKDLEIYAYIIMSNHVHLIAKIKDGSNKQLSNVIRDFKKYSAILLLKAIKDQRESRRRWMENLFAFNGEYLHQKFQIWQHGSHPIELYSPKVIWEKIHYIHLNPVRQGIVANPADYVYSSAGDYLERKGLLEVELMDFVSLS
ncbi:MAG: transposase [Saprospiraceae bacterium]